MKHYFKLVLALLFLVSVGLNFWQAAVRRPLPPKTGTELNSAHSAGGQTKSSFRVATYNIRRCQGGDGKSDCRRTAGVLEGFDIIGLNEVGGGGIFSRTNQAEELGRLLDMGWLFLPDQERYYREHFGNGLLSTFDITRWHREPLVFDRDSSHAYRNLTTLQFYFKGQLVTLLLTHLDRGQVHAEQLAYVIEKFHQSDRCILLGDFNTPGADPQLGRLLDKDTVVDAIHTALGPDDFRRADWIIVKGFEVKDGGFTPHGVSDHPLFWVELTLED